MIETKKALLAWARRMAEHEGVKCARFIVQSDGYVYAMPTGKDKDAVAWWPLPFLGVAGESEFAGGRLSGDLGE